MTRGTAVASAEVEDAGLGGEWEGRWRGDEGLDHVFDCGVGGGRDGGRGGVGGGVIGGGRVDADVDVLAAPEEGVEFVGGGVVVVGLGLVCCGGGHFGKAGRGAVTGVQRVCGEGNGP